MTRLCATLGDLSVYNAFYGAALVCIALDSAQLPWSPALLTGAALTAHATFLLDRVKLASHWQERGDQQSRPTRARLLHRYGLVLRVWVLAATLLACVLLGSIKLALSALPLLSVAGVLLYAGRPAGWSLKSITWLKTSATATSLCVWAAVISHGAGSPWCASIWASICLAPMVAADAWLCDIPDADSDRRNGIQTLATLYARRSVLLIAMFTSMFAVFPALASTLWMPVRGALLWHLAGQLLATGAIILVALKTRPRVDRFWMRDFVDLRLPICALTVHLILTN